MLTIVVQILHKLYLLNLLFHIGIDLYLYLYFQFHCIRLEKHFVCFLCFCVLAVLSLFKSDMFVIDLFISLFFSLLISQSLPQSLCFGEMCRKNTCHCKSQLKRKCKQQNVAFLILFFSLFSLLCLLGIFASGTW